MYDISVERWIVAFLLLNVLMAVLGIKKADSYGDYLAEFIYRWLGWTLAEAIVLGIFAGIAFVAGGI